MDVEIDNNHIYPEQTDNILFNVFKNVNVSVVGILVIVLVAYIAIFLTLGSSNSESATGVSKNILTVILEVILWALLVYIIYVSVNGYDEKDISFKAKMNNVLKQRVGDLKIDVDMSSNDVEEKVDEKEERSNSETEGEVFHIAGNKYTYEQAKNMCSKYDSRLATYDEIERAYNNGANWCSYGWSEDQMAFFPTQQSVYNELKTIKGHENDCGRPGINGGFIDNPKIKFGVNCFGNKPEAKDSDKEYMHRINHTPSPHVSKEEMKKSKEEDMQKYTIASFNKDKWSYFQ